MEITPAVAHSWEVQQDGRRYVFHLRDDVLWSDGTPVSARDFEHAWKRVLAPSTGSPNATLLYDIRAARAFHRGEVQWSEVGIRVANDLTLVVELEGATGYFLQLLALAATFPVPRHVVEALGPAWAEVQNIVTNGPFLLEAWKRGQSMAFSRNSGYFGRFGGNLQRVELSLLTDPAATLEMYEADRLDIVALPSPEVGHVRRRRAGEYLSLPSLATHYLGFDVSCPPFEDARVRQAVTLASDRETLADVATKGYFYPATGGFIPPGMPGHSAGISLPYNPQRAREILAEAGYPGGRGFPLVELATPPGRVADAAFLRAQWRENLGIDITLQTSNQATHGRAQDREPPQVFVSGWHADYPDPDNFLRVGFPWRATGWRNAAYEKLVEDARRVTDQSERMKLYGEADRILVEEAPIIPLVYGRWHVLVKPWVRKFPTSAIKLWFWKDVITEPH
jgi:oligopeptide transport system substrate-binding protein